jgi:hypothetical protein
MRSRFGVWHIVTFNQAHESVMAVASNKQSRQAINKRLKGITAEEILYRHYKSQGLKDSTKVGVFGEKVGDLLCEQTRGADIIKAMVKR